MVLSANRVITIMYPTPSTWFARHFPFIWRDQSPWPAGGSTSHSVPLRRRAGSHLKSHRRGKGAWVKTRLHPEKKQNSCSLDVHPPIQIWDLKVLIYPRLVFEIGIANSNWLQPTSHTCRTPQGTRNWLPTGASRSTQHASRDGIPWQIYAKF